MNPTHAALSPSKRHRWSACPASARIPDTAAPGPAAIDGTHSHTLLQQCIIGGLADPLPMVGSTLTDHDGAFTVDSDRAQRVKVAVDYVRRRVEHIRATGGTAEVLAETRADPARLVGRPDMSGTYDIAVVGGGVYELIDYKDGMHPVPAEKNLQLEQYAVGVLAEYPVRPYPFTEMWLTIIQPKLAAMGGTVIDTYKTTVEAIMEVVPRLQREGAACDDPTAPFIAGEAQCRYCPAKGSCPTLAEYTMAKAGLVFPVVAEAGVPSPLDPVDLVDQAASRDPVSMTPEQIVRVLEAAPLVRSMLAAVEEEATKRLNAGAVIPGLKLVAGRGSRKWALPEDQIAEKLKSMGMPKDAIWHTALISPAQVEKEVWKNRKGETKTLTEKQRKTIQTEYVSRIAGKPTVALASDDRPSLAPDVSGLFGAVTTEPSAPPVAPVEMTPALPDWLTVKP